MSCEAKKPGTIAWRVWRAFLLAVCVPFAASCGYFNLLDPYTPPGPPPPVTWEKRIGGTKDDTAYSVQQTTDGGYILCGSTCSFGAGAADVYLVKTDGAGEPEWSMTYGGAAADEGRCVRQTADGGFVVVGTTSSFGGGGEDVYLIKTNELGNEEWHKTFGGIGNEEGYCVQCTSDGGYIITGGTSSAPMVVDVVLIRTDADGNELWSKSYGDVFQDGGSCVRQTGDGGYIVAGLSEKQTSPPSVDDNAYLLKTDADGVEEWSECFGKEWLDIGTGVELTADGGYLLCGYTNSYGEGEFDALLVKTDGAGKLEWLGAYGGDRWDQAESVAQTSDGGYIFAGMSRSWRGWAEAWLVKTKSDGVMEWQQYFGGPNDREDATAVDWAYSVQQTADGGYILAGKTNSFGSPEGIDTDLDMYLIYYKP
jgi:hypothetical protein